MIYHWEKVIELICGSTSILLEPNKRIRILKRWCVETSITKMMNFRWHKMHFSKNNYEIHLQENSRFYKASSSRNFTWNFKILPIQNSHWQIYSHRSSNTLPLFLWLLSNVVPNDVNTTIINIKTKHYPFSTSTERMNLA